jgi:hypothetical protein
VPIYENRIDTVANDDSSDLKSKLNSEVFGTDLSACSGSGTYPASSHVSPLHHGEI